MKNAPPIIVIAVVILGLVTTFYGIYLAFAASILLGIIVLFAEPSPFIIGAVKLLAGIDIAQKIVEFFSK